MKTCLAPKGAKEPVDIALPYTLGKWETTQPVEIALVKGKNILHCTRHVPNYGVSAPEGARLFKTEWELPAAANILWARAWLTADNGFDLQVNGKPVCNGKDWQTVYAADLARHLHAGKNQVQIRALNAEPGPAGLLARLTVRLADGQTITRVTGDKGWLSSKDGVTWAPALLVGAYGCPPWGQIQSDPITFIDFIHRTADGTEIYFLANRKDQAATLEATFRVSGRQPELWDPVSGQRRDLPRFESKNGCTTVPLEFEPNGSMFVVFRKALAGTDLRAVRPANFPKCKPLHDISGPWTVQFDPQWFYPTDGLSGDQAKGLLVFDKLEDWTQRPEPAIQYFSGTAVYRKTFGLADPSTIQNPKSKIHLDLGTVKETAKVRLNGQDLGAVWCHPWRVEITGAIKPGENKLEIEVVNLWPNRLAGDGKLPAEQRRTRTNIGAESVLSSGLLGPLRVMGEE